MQWNRSADEPHADAQLLLLVSPHESALAFREAIGYDTILPMAGLIRDGNGVALPLILLGWW